MLVLSVNSMANTRTTTDYVWRASIVYSTKPRPTVRQLKIEGEYMFKKILLSSMIVGVMLATPATKGYRVDIFEDSVVR